MTSVAVDVLIVTWALCAIAGAALLGRLDHAGTGFVLGGLLGPLGLVVILLKRRAWQRHWTVDSASVERERKEQALREWRGY